jgi:hypothetical protein
MKKRIISFIGLMIILISCLFLIKNYLEKEKIEKLKYNEKVLIKTLDRQNKYVIDNKSCPNEISETIKNIRKHLKLIQDKLKIKNIKVNDLNSNKEINDLCNIN